MLALKYLLMILGVGLFGSAGALVVYDIFISEQLRRLLSRSKTTGSGAESGITAHRPFGPVRWRLAQRLAISAVLPILLALSIVVIPDGSAGVRVSQIWGARRGTLYPGVHFVTPLVDSVALYDTREQVYSTAASTSAKSENEVLVVEAREGLNIGLAVSVRYRLDPRRLDTIHANLPQPVGEQVVAPVVSTIYRQLAPNFVTEEIFATKREELRSKAAAATTARLESDGILVREVLLRDLQLPAEYAKGLARKESTLQNAEAAAQAKIIDSKAEVERQRNLSDAEANRIRVTAAADAERMKFEASVLKQNPMLIQKIIAERLSDKLQIMMVPMDGKNFFANDVMHSAFSGVTSGNNNASSDDSADSDGSALAPTVSAQKRPAKRP